VAIFRNLRFLPQGTLTLLKWDFAAQAAICYDYATETGKGQGEELGDRVLFL